MSVTEYKYQYATYDQLCKCIRWCQNQFQLRDWEIDFSTESLPPKRFTGDEGVMTCYGKAWINIVSLKAEIWVNLDFIKAENSNPYSTVIHEIIHILVLERAEDMPEQCVSIMEPMLYRLYCHENGLKVMDEK